MNKLFYVTAILFTLSLVIAGYYLASPNRYISNHLQEKEDLKTAAYLESFYDNTSDYDSVFDNNQVKTNENVVAGIISHHFLAKSMIADFFMGIDPNSIEVVIIVGPDHFQALSGKKPIVATSTLNWNTPFGEAETNSSLIEELIDNPQLITDDNTFRSEHSIFTLIPFVKKVFPGATVVPLILKNEQNYQLFYDMGKLFHFEKSLLIVSSDFSHQATLNKAQENDIKSIELLERGSMEDVQNIVSDCNQCIAFLYGYLDGMDFDFVLNANKTSKDFGETNDSNLTSYISAYFILDDTKHE